MLAADKLRKKFLLLLRSTVVGEAMAARDALLRICKAEGYGPHELTDALIAGTKEINGANGGEVSSREMAQRCLDCFEAGLIRLSDKEQKFVRDMIGWRGPSEKQLDWLKAIYERTT